jgi:hypothetical protein
MKRKIILSLCAVVAIGASSCKKSWNCICEDNGNQVTVATYKETKFLDAKDKCDEKQAEVRVAFPNASCNIK